jgi:non-specific serine/threonine protein kinase/serine/threonine-protein kinase
MNEAERWTRVSEILSRALDLPETERTAFLAEAIRNQPLLRTEVLGMFEDLRGVDAFLESSAAPPATLDDAFGPYRVLGELGEGGMGIVYLAERSDGQFTRRVAIKRIGRAAPGSELLRRFRDERKILARLDHANIARLLDAGMDTGGVPYLVMEYVEGTPLTSFCRERQLAVARRLKLFLKVCAAVQHAHQNLVIHRDIKPGNLLVTGDGEPKLLDFGIAKLVSGADLDDATRTVHPALTLDYASPEQVRGEPANTSSDVYSLGVVLYELLADTKPYECGSRSVADAVRTVCDFVPPPPSQVAPRERRDSLTGDLDVIVQKAMEKSPSERYSSAADLAADVEAYLEHRPLRARSPSLRYRARKLARRHRVGVAVAASALVLLAAGIAAILWQARVAERERRRAEARFQDVRRLANSVIYELHDAIANLPGATDARHLLVTRALEYLDRLAGEARDDLGLQRELADAYQRIAQVQNSGLGANVGDTRASLESYGKALAIRQSLAARDPADSKDLFGLALVEFELGTLQRATGEIGLAEQSFLSTASRFEALAGEGALPDQHRRLAAVYQRLAELQTFQGKRDAALGWAEKAHSEAEAGWRERRDDAASRSGLAAASYELAVAQAALGRYADALERTRSARALLEAGLRENPLDAHQTRVLLYVLNGEGEYLRMLGSLPEAVRVREQALEVAEEAWRRDPADRWSQAGVAVAASQLGDVLLEFNDVEDSIRRFRQALGVAKQAFEEDPQYDFARLEAASAEYGLGRALLTSGTADDVAEGCAALRSVHSFWSGRRSEDALPANEAEELDRLADWLARCPSGAVTTAR